MNKISTFTAILHKENDLYVAECPEVGTASQGYTIEEALANLQEATEGRISGYIIATSDHYDV